MPEDYEDPSRPLRVVYIGRLSKEKDQSTLLEAMQQAAVPVIAVGHYSGTSQFALDRRSRFPEKNPEALANRIDYWLANPEERWEMGHIYAKEIQKYDIRRSVAALLDMFQKAIDLNKKA